MPVVSDSATASSPNVVLPETFVWLTLGLVLLATHGREMAAWSAVALFCRRSFHWWWAFDSNESSSRRRRNRSSSSSTSRNSGSNRSVATTTNKLWRIPEEQGLAILILTSLWTLVRPVGYQSNAWIIPWILANRDSLLAWVLSSSSSSPSPSLSVYLVASLGLLGLWCHTAWRWYAPGKMLVAHFLGDNIIHHVAALQQVFSLDEWQTFAFLAAGVWLQWMEDIVTKRQEGFYYYYNLRDNPDMYSTLVACAGNIGIVWGVSWVSSQRLTWPLGLQLIVLAILPLVLVEVSLYLVTVVEEDIDMTESILEWLPQALMPRCIRWLLYFLMQSEEPLWDTVTPVPVPRVVWLVYWALIVAIGISAAPTGSSRVVTRKWFHGVAVLLFTPVTVYAPGLQSMGYAIAVAVLIALEGVRPCWPLLQQFYVRYLDPAKDGRGMVRDKGGGRSRDVMIISHTALILGCAMPLWCYQLAGDRLSPVVPFIGIAVVGVGDACGAVIGKFLGRNLWSAWLQNLPRENHRTIEGSIAMGLSQVVFVGFLGLWGIPVQWSVVSLPLLFSTFLEAWTSQMDNLMLPLAVTGFYGLWEQALAGNTWASS